ncbi:MAG: hypothetical protein HZA64_12680 [Rhodocyclales bacterium]|nr:hypothetical protein [Rhodocyclales bacterium]
MADSPLHPSIVAMVSLAANIAANHPKKGLCQLERLRGYGVAEEQIDMVVDIARHIRDEAGQMLDAAFDDEAQPVAASTGASPRLTIAIDAAPAACCTPTAKGNACC